MKRRVVVTGIGMLTPLGNSPDEFWQALAEGRSGIRQSARLSGMGVGAVDFDAAVAGVDTRGLDRVSQFACAAALQALRSAALDPAAPMGGDAGVFFGTGMGGAETTEQAYARYFGQADAGSRRLAIPSAMAHAPASHVGLRFKVEGECQTYSTACSSSAVAIGEAFRRIRDGYLDRALAGGAECQLFPAVVENWRTMRVLCRDPTDAPGTGCRPFSRDRSGFALGEGASVLVLETMESAEQRGVEPICELVGYGVSNDATHLTRPDSQGQSRAMSRALADARIDADRIGHINAHGTGTLVGDEVETRSIKQVFGRRAADVPVSATKSSHGHLLGAAGAVEFAAAALALRHQFVPPTAFWSERDPGCDLDYVPGLGRSVHRLEYVMSNSFAFGGNNVSLVARRWT